MRKKLNQVLRLILIILFGAALFLSFNSFLTRPSLLSEICRHGSCDETGQLPMDRAKVLAQAGISVSFYAQYKFVLDLFTVIIFMVIAFFIIVKRTNITMGIYTSVLLLYLGTSFTVGTLTFSSRLWELPVKLHQLIAWILFIPFFFLFPNGKHTPKWTKYLSILWIITEVPYTLYPNSLLSSRTWPEWLSGLYFFGFLFTCIFAQVFRYKKTASNVERLQIKWFIFSLILFVCSIFISGLAGLLPEGINSLFRSIFFLITVAIQALTLCLIPLSIAYAILKHRLWHIDFILSRTLTYVSLTFIVVCFHVFFVSGLGALVRDPDNLIISLVSTSIIAVLFQPLTVYLQRMVNRLIYGDRDEPLTILTRLADQLEGTLPITHVLPTILETTMKALKLPFIEITLKNGMSHHLGAALRESASFPLMHQGEEIGLLKVGFRTANENFSKRDFKVLNHLVKQIGIAAHSVLINTELQKSREKLVSTREEERRRLRRDLHDGVGPSLAAQTIKVGVAKQLLYNNPKAAEELLSSLEDDLGKTLTDIRHLIYDLRPPSLDDLGLLGAVKEFAAQIKRPHTGDKAFDIKIYTNRSDLTLSAAIEVAAFRIIQEALTNVIRHSKATSCMVEFQADEKGLAIVIGDNGKGMARDFKRGVGLSSMKERAEEVGGFCSIQSTENQGTRVEVYLPYMEEGYGANKGVNR
ncbi:GAF domain-containing sensor histidine kinase [Ectobacillus funiculus]|uniref:GAF domain-containing sensor histidine kinase n=1 Tax=Ectobacillus funiculus TaxID=137993 RepID=UPI00397BC51E